VKHNYSRYLIKLAILIAAYYSFARMGLRLNAVSGYASLIWAPTGIALAALLILGYRFWPGITIAAFIVNLVTGAPPVVALGIAIGNTLEALLGTYLLAHFVQFRSSLERVRDVLGLVLFASIISTLISATIGVSSLVLGDIVSPDRYSATWLAWWVGDMLGALVIAPLLLIWSTRFRTALRSQRMLEALLYTLALVCLSVFVFQGSLWVGVKPFTFAYVIFPILIWIALRFGQIGSVTATFVVSLISIWSTIISFSLSGNNILSQNLLLLQSFIGITAITFMTMAAVVAEREQTQKHQQHLIQKTKMLTKQQSRLLALNQAKDEFVSLASHQLRTPATGVKQYVGMLLENYAGKLTKTQRDMLQYAYDCNERQIQVINDLLHVAQVDAGTVVLKKVKIDVVVLISEVLDGQASVFATNKQSVRFTHDDDSFIVPVDKDRVRMVLENIIDNACKYSTAGKKIEVLLTKNTQNLTIAIKDNGIGITEDSIDRLFKKFSRIDNPLSIAAEGTGLGLYWAKKIIDLHNGSISVESVPNQGSTFSIALPIENN